MSKDLKKIVDNYKKLYEQYKDEMELASDINLMIFDLQESMDEFYHWIEKDNKAKIHETLADMAKISSDIHDQITELRGWML